MTRFAALDIGLFGCVIGQNRHAFAKERRVPQYYCANGLRQAPKARHPRRYYWQFDPQQKTNQTSGLDI